MTMNDLQAQVEQLSSEIAMERARGNFSDADRKAEDLARLLEQMDTIKKAEVIAEVQAPLSSFGISIGGTTVDFREVTASEEAYQALTIAVRLKMAELEQQSQEEISALKASYAAENQQQFAKYHALYEDYNLTLLERNDFRGKWECAANERNDLATDNETMKAELDSYKSQVVELRNQISKPTEPTNMDSGALADAMKKLNASKPGIYNLREHNGHYLANLIETGEEIQINWINKGKYREVSTDEVNRFRAELEAHKEEAATTVSDHLELTIEPPFQFQIQDDNTACELGGNAIETESLPDHDGESFEQEIRRRLNRVENALGIVA